MTDAAAAQREAERQALVALGDPVAQVLALAVHCQGTWGGFQKAVREFDLGAVGSTGDHPVAASRNVGPWVSRRLAELGVPTDSFVELRAIRKGLRGKPMLSPDGGYKTELISMVPVWLIPNGAVAYITEGHDLVPMTCGLTQAGTVVAAGRRNTPSKEPEVITLQGLVHLAHLAQIGVPDVFARGTVGR